MGVCREDNGARRRDVTSAMCDHLFDTTSHYDEERKLLTFVVL
jgi:hypothetical protein